MKISRVRQALADLAEKLGLLRPALKRARRRYKKRARKAKANHERALWLEGRADELRAVGYPDAAAWRDQQAHKRHRKANHFQDAAQKWLHRIKRLNQRIHKLEVRRDELRAALKKIESRGVVIEGNRATGGSKSDRLAAVALASAEACASGRRHNFYSQPGGWDVDHCITGESRDKRSDCSQWATADYKSAGLADPNGNRYQGGWTGTLADNGRVVPVSQIQPGDLVLYGPAPHHHVEMYVGPGGKTIGHGSAPIDAGIIDLFGDGDFTVRRYI